MKAYVYILQDDNGVFYVGSTTNINQRIRQHSSNNNLAFTGRLKNPKLVLSQEYDSVTMARKIENRIKKLKRKDYIERMVKDGFIKLKIK
jgi:putative endonuclease